MQIGVKPCGKDIQSSLPPLPAWSELQLSGRPMSSALLCAFNRCFITYAQLMTSLAIDAQHSFQPFFLPQRRVLGEDPEF